MDMVEALRYKLRMFGEPIDGSANVFCDNKAIYKNTISLKYVLKKNIITLPTIGSGRQ